MKGNPGVSAVSDRKFFDELNKIPKEGQLFQKKKVGLSKTMVVRSWWIQNPVWEPQSASIYLSQKPSETSPHSRAGNLVTEFLNIT